MRCSPGPKLQSSFEEPPRDRTRSCLSPAPQESLSATSKPLAAVFDATGMTHNQRAIGLYTKMGYHVEGTREAALLVDNQLVDELWMPKLLK
jgi:hypothetical protein